MDKEEANKIPMLLNMSNRSKLLIFIATCFLDLGLFHVAVNIAGSYIFLFMVIPVIVAAVLYGTRFAIYITLIQWLLSSGYFLYFQISTPNIIVRLASVALINVLIGFTIGKFRAVSLVFNNEIERRKSAENEIKKNTQKLENEIAERQKAIKNLHDSEIRFRSLVEKAGIAICTNDREGRFLYFNKQFSELFGYNGEEISSTRISMHIHQDDRESSIEWFNDRLDGHSNQTRSEFMGLRKDGTEIHLEVETSLVKHDGVIYGIQLYIWDITDRKTFEMILRDSEERFRSMFENSTLGMFRKSPEGKILMVNPALLQILSSLSNEELGRFNPETEEAVHAYQESDFKKALDEQGKVIGYEQAWEGWDGPVFYIRKSAWVIRDESGKPLYYDGIIEDITYEKLALAEKDRAEAELKKAERELKVLSGLLPICAHCKRIRDEENDWLPIEEYIDDHSEAEFSHGLCPDCTRELYPGVV